MPRARVAASFLKLMRKILHATQEQQQPPPWIGTIIISKLSQDENPDGFSARTADQKVPMPKALKRHNGIRIVSDLVSDCSENSRSWGQWAVPSVRRSMKLVGKAGGLQAHEQILQEAQEQQPPPWIGTTIRALPTAKDDVPQIPQTISPCKTLEEYCSDRQINKWTFPAHACHCLYILIISWFAYIIYKS